MIYFVSSGRQHLNSISLCLYSGQWNSVCVCVFVQWLQSDEEDLDIAPAQTEEGFTFDANVQMPDDGFQLWWQSHETYLLALQCWSFGSICHCHTTLSAIYCSRYLRHILSPVETVFNTMGAFCTEVMILGDDQNPDTTCYLQSCLWCGQLQSVAVSLLKVFLLLLKYISYCLNGYCVRCVLDALTLLLLTHSVHATSCSITR